MIDEAYNFIRNRREFYAVLMPRIPDPRLRGELVRAVSSSLDQDIPKVIAEMSSEVMSGDLTKSLVLQDFLKTADAGTSLGRTIVSFEEALNRAAQVEETGLLFFDSLVRETRTADMELFVFAEHCRQSLSRILQLSDDLRYRVIQVLK